MKPLYKQDVHHFDNLYPTSKAHESQAIRAVHSETKIQILFLCLRGRPLCFQQYQRFSILLRIKIMFIDEKIIYLGLFDMKLLK